MADAAAKNTALRQMVNKQIAEIWQRKTLKNKAALRSWAMESEKSFQLYLELLRGVNPTPYDIAGDPIGELVWRRIAETIAAEQPFKISDPKKVDAAGVAAVVQLWKP